ncbi:DUF305 domain-containing protein [Alteromonas sp. ASW11-19]|uniref:DUF305 domain-containing protein n=1 Tax=Alteromonas salexigens TaxID=2982530 RepID=A0ABT2VQJ0_9ALTE|nr:DUF305 domain-containing protein [Alteromonas salexigens]MCU7555577.1 DUF305 domain-containing protein [Alteromonas salexigens]
MKYMKFLAMILTSTIAMFIMMYLNTYAASHVWFSETRTYMALYMGAGMAIIMLVFMLGMYTNKKLNIAILLSALVIFAGCIYLVRSQTTVSDSAYMKAMIPHHSIAILTSERANIEDIRVRELANEIIKAQRKEIKEMEWLIQDIAENGKVTSATEADQRRIPDFKGRVNKANGDE